MRTAYLHSKNWMIQENLIGFKDFFLIIWHLKWVRADWNCILSND